MTPEIVGAIRDKKLLPVLELERGFIRPSYPQQVIVSYYEWVQDLQSFFWGETEVVDKLFRILETSFTQIITLSRKQKLPMRLPQGLDKLLWCPTHGLTRQITPNASNLFFSGLLFFLCHRSCLIKF